MRNYYYASLLLALICSLLNARVVCFYFAQIYLLANTSFGVFIYLHQMAFKCSLSSWGWVKHCVYSDTSVLVLSFPCV
uniref:Putative secreted protein n=1 Tax=Rhipicephalus microplus TaxID=6941 RepID=A0A6M2DDW5_RHIMP